MTVSSTRSRIHPLLRHRRPRHPGASPAAPSTSSPSSRDRMLSEIQRHLRRGNHVLLVGVYGMGKSWLLQRVAAQQPQAIQLSLLQSKRATVLTVCERLFADGALVVPGASDWAEALKKLKPQSIAQLCTLIEPHLHNYLFIIDDLEKATERTMEEIIKPLLAGRVLAAADLHTKAKRRRLAPIIDRFKRMNAPCMDDGEVKQMLWSLLDRGKIKHWQALEAKVVRTAQGQPGVVFDLCEQLRGSGGSLLDVRELEHTSAGVVRINLLAPTVVTLLVVLMASRYLAYGFSDTSLGLMAGAAYAVSLALRPLLYHALRES